MNNTPNNNSIQKEIELDSLASSVWANKYKLGNEKCPQDTINRLVKEFTNQLIQNSKDWDTNNKNISQYGQKVTGRICNEGNKMKKTLLSELVKNSLGFNKIIPGGSAIFGIGNLDANSSISNCFVIDYPHDSLEGINYRINEMCCLEKARGGVGVNLSTLRPKGSTVRNQSKTSTGVETFVVDFSQNNNIVAQDGRRGALMICLDVNHPDVLDFVRLKEDLTKVTGANLSVLIDDSFMEDVIQDNDYFTTFPLKTKEEIYEIIRKDNDSLKKAKDAEYGVLFKIGDVYFKKFSAKYVWDEICRCAWKMAEPGILFRSNWIKGGTDGCYTQYRPVATNPCSEIAMQPYDSCRLMSYNLTDCVVNPYTKKAYVDFDRLYTMSYNQMLLCDTMIDIEITHIENIISKIKNDPTTPQQIKNAPIKLYNKILENTKNGRRCGCGFTGFGDMMASLGFDFNKIKNKQSAEYNIIEKVFAMKMAAELDCSIDLAIMNGSPFKYFDSIKDLSQMFFKDVSKFKWTNLLRMKEFGRRNVSWSTAAPAGTISLLAGTTSGIEPLFMPFYIRRVKVDSNKQEYDYVDVDGNKFKEFISLHRGLVRWFSVYKNISYEEAFDILTSKKSAELDEIFKKSPYYKQCANDLDSDARLACQELVQKYTTHSISSTLNLPSTATQEEISKIYMNSWRLGLKGNTVYRDGCRGGVIVSVDEKDKKPEHRPDDIEGILHRLKISKNWYGILIGFVNNEPYEIFVLNGMEALKDFSSIKFHGVISKIKDVDGNSVYVFNQNENDYNTDYEDDTNPYLIELHDLDDMENRDEKLLSLMISKLFRSGCSVNEVINIIDKSQPISGTFSSRLIKILAEYSKEEELKEKCPSCGAHLHRENGCKICKNCGWSACN